MLFCTEWSKRKLSYRHACHEGKFNEQEILANCYRNCLDEATEYNCRSIAFCCISVGVYRYPLKSATRIAIATVAEWLKEHESDILVRFCCYSDREFDTYLEVADELGIQYATNRGC